MTEKPGTVESAVYNNLSNVFGKMGLDVPDTVLAKMAARVTRQAFQVHGDPAAQAAAQELHKVLYGLWIQAGEPSVRQMSRDMGKSHMTWHNALRCRPLPTWKTFSQLVRYLDGEPGEHEELWQRARGETIVL